MEDFFPQLEKFQHIEKTSITLLLALLTLMSTVITSFD